jgi:hypothetical protein
MQGLDVGGGRVSGGEGRGELPCSAAGVPCAVHGGLEDHGAGGGGVVLAHVDDHRPVAVESDCRFLVVR